MSVSDWTKCLLTLRYFVEVGTLFFDGYLILIFNDMEEKARESFQDFATRISVCPIRPCLQTQLVVHRIIFLKYYPSVRWIDNNPIGYKHETRVKMAKYNSLNIYSYALKILKIWKFSINKIISLLDQMIEKKMTEHQTSYVSYMIYIKYSRAVLLDTLIN